MTPGRRTPSERRAARAATIDPAVVLAAALRLLEIRPRSTSEVSRRLSLLGYPDALIGQVVDRLVELEILDDRAFARAWVESRDRAHPRGERALRAELRQRGVANSVIEQVLIDRATEPSDERSDVGDGGADEAAASRFIAARRAALDRIADPRRRREHAYALLARRGFDPDVCRRVAGRTITAPPPDDPDVRPFDPPGDAP